MTPYELAVCAGLLVLCAIVVWWTRRIARGIREEIELHRLRAEGYDLSGDGIVICSTCGENWCGQCGDSRMGFTFTEYKERYWT